MYGKIFNDIYGSTVAEFGGDTMYVLMSMVVLSDAGGYLRMTPVALARTIRKDLDVVGRALVNLEADDPESSSPDHNGRRIIKLSEVTQGQENRGWWVVNKVKYARIVSEEERAKKNSVRQQRFRDKAKEGQKTVTQSNASNVLLRYVDEDVDVNEIKDLGQNKNRFDLFWSSYPKKVKRKKAIEIWKRKKLDPLAEKLSLDVENRLQNDRQWKEGFIPDPTTYLNGELWDDEIQKAQPREPVMKSKSEILRVGTQMGITARPGESMEDYTTRVRTTRG